MSLAATFTASLEPTFDVDKLSYEIFSVLESKFLFGYDPDPNIFLSGITNSPATGTLKPCKNSAGKVRILSIDGGGATDGILAAKSLARLESILRQKTGNPDASIADFFDVAAGSGAGGILAGLLFTRGTDGRPLFRAADALKFLAEKRSASSGNGIFRKVFRQSKTEESIYLKTFGEYTLKDTLKPVLIPCYDLSSGAPFLFSRADALETDGYDFKMSNVCLATSATRAIKMRSVEGSTRIVAVGGDVAMNNPTAAAITHVLNNKQEFPFCRGVEDLLVVSLGNGDSDSGMYGRRDLTPSAGELVRIAGEGVADMANGFNKGISQIRNSDIRSPAGMSDDMLSQKCVESVLFQGKKIAEKTNAEKLEGFAAELIKEHERRKSCILPTVVMKQATPRSSSATTSSSSC